MRLPASKGLIAFRIMRGNVEVLLERLLATIQSIAVVAFKDVTWGPNVLVESTLVAK